MHIPRGGREREESREGGREKERGGGEREREREMREIVVRADTYSHAPAPYVVRGRL